MWGAIIGAGISAAGSLLSSHLNNKASANAAANAVQTRVSDLRAAGLNPVLAAQNGSMQAATVPQRQGFDFSSAGQIYAQRSQRMQAETQAVQTASNVELQKAQALQANSASAVQVGQLDLQKAQENLTNQQALTEVARRANYAANTGLASANQVRTQYQTMQDKVLADYLATPEGAERARTNYSGSTTLGILDTLRRRFIPSGTSSAKDVKNNNHVVPPEFRNRIRKEFGLHNDEVIYPLNTWK